MYEVFDNQHDYIFTTDSHAIAWLYVARHPGAYFYEVAA